MQTYNYLNIHNIMHLYLNVSRVWPRRGAINRSLSSISRSMFALTKFLANELARVGGLTYEQMLSAYANHVALANQRFKCLNSASFIFSIVHSVFFICLFAFFTTSLRSFWDDFRYSTHSINVRFFSHCYFYGIYERG